MNMSGAKTVPRISVNKSRAYKNNDFKPLSPLKDTKNIRKNVFQVP